jgi:hypothetical protein
MEPMDGCGDYIMEPMDGCGDYIMDAYVWRATYEIRVYYCTYLGLFTSAAILCEFDCQ